MTTQHPSAPNEPSTAPAGRAEAAADGHTITWPSDRFYWCILESTGAPVVGSTVPSATTSASLLDAGLEEHLPLPLEQVHAVYRRIDAQRVLACALPWAALEAAPATAVVLCPDAVPSFVSAVTDLSPSTLNMLIGRYESKPVRAQRSHRRRMLAAAIVVVCSLVVLGLIRRERSWNESARLTDAAFQTLARQLQPDPAVRVVDVPARLRRDIDDLTRTLQTPDPARDSTTDAAMVLEAVLTSWPTQSQAPPHARTDLISVAPGSVTMTVQVDGDAHAFIAGLTPPAGWSLDPPRLNVVRGASQLSIQLKRALTKGAMP